MSETSERVTPERFTDPQAAVQRAVTALEKVTAGFGPQSTVREGQLHMVREVAKAIESNTKVSVAAPTGTGKSLAYLVPLVASGKRGVVVVSSLALQDQLAQKDLPFVEAALGPVDWAVVKGRARYVCLQKLQEAKAAVSRSDQSVLFEVEDSDQELSEIAVDQIRHVIDWAGHTDTGDLVELPFELVADARRLVVTGSDECIGREKCPYGQVCHSENARARAKEAQVTIVNSSLFAMDLGLDGALLGKDETRPEVVILDEAHEAEDTFANALAGTVSIRKLRALAASAARLVTMGDDDGPKDTPPARVRTLVRRLRALTAENSDLVVALESAAGTVMGEEGLGTDHPLLHPLTEVMRVVFDLDRTLDDLERFAGGPGTPMGGRAARVQRFAHQEALAFTDVTSPLDGDSMWVDNNGQELVRAPIDMSRLMSMKGVWKDRAVVFTSATFPQEMAIRLGFTSSDPYLTVKSPFNTNKTCKVYIPSGLPETKHPTWRDAAWVNMETMIRAAGGRTLALFTSLANMEFFAEKSREALPYPILMQGDAPKAVLTKQFAEDEATCLFASSSFFTGVDVPGPSLSLVIVDKIPFPRPDDPLWVARRRKAGDEWKSYPVRRDLGPKAVRLMASFGSVDVPRAGALLAQAAGRLIRSTQCTGVVMILDPRLRGLEDNKKKWGYRHLLLDQLQGSTTGSQATAIQFLADALKIPEPVPLWERQVAT